LWSLSGGKEKPCEEGDAETQQGSGGKKEMRHESYVVRPQEACKSQHHPCGYE
jgi:hypothetical protein